MLNSKEQLMSQARTSGYKPEILEKVYRLLDVFQQIMSVPFLQERLVLKGGTALNLFCFEQLPRLSVDIDLNYIGALDREKMLEEKPMIMDAIQQIMSQNQFERHRAPMIHAGGKMVWFYPSLLGVAWLAGSGYQFYVPTATIPCNFEVTEYSRIQAVARPCAGYS